MIETERLILRPWREADRAPYLAMMADPEVGYWLGGVLDAAEANAQVDRLIAQDQSRMPGWLVLCRRGEDRLLGAAVLRPVAAGHPLAGEVEIGWRLARTAWGEGYATEAARALVAEGFGPLGLADIVSFTTTTNVRSRAVMERLGFLRDPSSDFDHPALAIDHPLRPHVVYRLRNQR